MRDLLWRRPVQALDGVSYWTSRALPMFLTATRAVLWSRDKTTRAADGRWGLLYKHAADSYLSCPSQLCPSRESPAPRLPWGARGAYSSPPRRSPKGTAANPENRILRRVAGGQTDHLKDRQRLAPERPRGLSGPNVYNSLNPFFDLTYLKSFSGRRVRSWLRMNAGGAPNTCKSRG